MGDSIPASLGRYVIQQEIGRGMMGAVYRALDPNLGRTVALKTVRLAFAVSERELEQFEKRFLTEALAAGQLSHPGIVIVHDVGRDAETGTLYIALEYLEGSTLERLAEQPMEWRAALRLVARIADALSHAHSRGIVHRDIKPANIMVLPDGSPKIMDFGIAKLPASTLTMAGQFFGTPAYMSPEQAAGAPVDGRSDLFSLGGILYLLLTGKRAFPGNSIPAIVAGVQTRDPQRPSTLVAGLPEDVDYVIARALAKDLALRYPDGRLLAEDLEDIGEGRVPRHRAGWVEPAPSEGTVVSTARPAVAPQPLAALASTPPPGPAAASLALTPEPLAAGSVPPQASPVRLGTAPPAPRPTSTAAVTAGRPSQPPHPVSAGIPAAPARPRGSSRSHRRLIVAVAGGLAAVTLLGLGLWITRRAAGPKDAGVEDGAPDATLAEPATPRPQPRESAGPAPARDAATRPAAKSPWSLLPGLGRPASLEIAVEHSLRKGTLRLWLDDDLVVEEAIVGRVQKKILVYKARRGILEKTVPVPPGEHRIRVRIDAGDDVMEAETTATFEGGVARRLEVDAGGLLKKRINLEWAQPEP